MNTLKILTVVLLLTVWQPLRAQEARTNSSQNQNTQEEPADPDNKSIKETYWNPSNLGKGIYYKGYVGINTTTPERDLDVIGTARVSVLEINGQYSLPTTKATAGYYLNGLGEWAPMRMSGGTGYWHDVIAGKDAIAYDGFVGIKTGVNLPQYTLDVNGSVGVQSLEIIGQYALPEKAGTEDEFLRGDGVWAVPSAGGGGDCLWHRDDIGNGSIYFMEGKVGIRTTAPSADLHVQGNMKLGSNIGSVGKNAFAGGDGSTASGTNSFAFGENVKATMRAAFAGGKDSEANSIGAVALGQKAIAGRTVSIAIGNYVEANAGNAIVFGGGSIPDKLVNSNPSSLMIGFNSTVPTFFVSQSSGAGTTGNIGIGNMTDPQAKLHIYSDADKPATLKLEHRTTGTKRYAEIGLGTHSIRAGNTENMVFSTPDANRHFVFENGNVGIGVTNPGSKLEVAGDILFTGQLLTEEGPFQSSPWQENGDDIYYTNGRVGIGTIPPQKDSKLYVLGNAMVEGQVYADEVIVEEAANWPDYVFESDYQLMDLTDLKDYIEAHKHLPGTPKADENGAVQHLRMSEMNALLLRKIEELTLYILEQEERIRELENSMK